MRYLSWFRHSRLLRKASWTIGLRSRENAAPSIRDLAVPAWDLQTGRSARSVPTTQSVRVRCSSSVQVDGDRSNGGLTRQELRRRSRRVIPWRESNGGESAEMADQEQVEH